MTPTRPVFVAATAARAPGSTAPSTGSASSARKASRAYADAVLHATTIIFTPSPTRNRAALRE